MGFDRKLWGDKEAFLGHLKEKLDQDAALAQDESLTQKVRQFRRGVVNGLEYAMSAVEDWQVEPIEESFTTSGNTYTHDGQYWVEGQVWVEGPMAALEQAISLLHEYRADEGRIDEVCGLLEWVMNIYDPEAAPEGKNAAYAAYKQDARQIGAEDE
jgi:hypothetical protein